MYTRIASQGQRKACTKCLAPGKLLFTCFLTSPCNHSYLSVQARAVHGLSQFPTLGPKRDNNTPTDFTSRNYNYMLVAGTATGTYTKHVFSPERPWLTLFLVGAVMAKSVVGTFLSALQPARNLMAVANIEVDLSKIPEGHSVTLEWRGKPLFVRHREQWEIDEGMPHVPVTCT